MITLDMLYDRGTLKEIESDFPGWLSYLALNGDIVREKGGSISITPAAEVERIREVEDANL